MNLGSTLTMHAAKPWHEQRICLDYDDTLAEGPYQQGKVGKLSPEGMKLAKWIIAQGYSLYILTARPSKEWSLIKKQLTQAGINVEAVSNKKVPALAYPDNRGVQWKNSAAGAIRDIRPLLKAT